MSLRETYTDAGRIPDVRDHRTGAPESATQDPIRARLMKTLGGTRGVIDGGLPPLLFAVVNAVVGANSARPVALGSAIAAAATTGAVIVVLRLIRREPLRQALGGLAGLAIAIAFALQSGEARGFFLPGIYVDAAYAVVFLVTALIGRPAVGALYGLLSGRRTGWRGDRRLRRIMAMATVGWSLVFAMRAGAQSVLYVHDEPALLAAGKLILGWPLTILALVLTLAAIRRASGDAGT